MPVQPYDLTIADSTLLDLQVRLAATRLTVDDAADWDGGASPAYLRRLLDYWRSGFDWRAQEAQLRQFSHFRTTLGDTAIHFIHERGRGDAPMPIILTHGFPDSFARFVKLIPLLVDPGAHGSDPRDSFDVVVPSLPGFGFSGPPDRASDIFHVADRWHELMTRELGYERYGGHGGDWGSTVTERLARGRAGTVIGIHLTDVPFLHAFHPPADLRPAEIAYLEAIERFQSRDGAYALLHGHRPHTLADVLNDSPAGLAAWLLPFFERWSDGGVEARFTLDELLTNIMIYWATGTIDSALAPYYDVLHAGATRWVIEKARDWVGASRVPAGFALFPRDISQPPREWAERFFTVERWTEMPRGGHFAALEEPELLAEDIRAFFRPLRGPPDPVALDPSGVPVITGIPDVH